MKFEGLLSIKIGKILVWSLTTTLLLIEAYERLTKKIGLDVYTFLLFLLCVLLILIILEIIVKNKGIFKYKKRLK